MRIASLPSQYGLRYLDQKSFIDLCDKLEIKLLSSSVNEKWLEYLEKKKILYPDSRIILPAGYAKYKEEMDLFNFHDGKIPSN